MTLDPFDPAQRDGLVALARDNAQLHRFRRSAPARYRAATLETVSLMHGPAVFAPLGRWVESRRGALVLVGPPGTGKTWAAWAVLAYFARRGSIVGGSFATVLDSLRPTDDDEGGRARAWYALTGAGAVLLDDVGAEKLTPWAAEKLDSIVDARWAVALPTIVTSNLTAADLADHVGPRAWSRLTGSDSLVLRLAGADLRRSPQ